MNNIPTLIQLYTGILADLEAKFSISIPGFGKNYLRAQAAVQAAKLKIFYYFLADIQKNIFVDNADPESMGGTLERFGRVKLNRNPFPATAGNYRVIVTGINGAIIASQTTFKSNDDSSNPGKLFILDTPFTFTGTSGTITLRALEAGLESQLNVADELTATIPIANVQSIATVSLELVAPLAAEDIEDYREKVLQSYRQEPNGGAATDYRLWAFDAQGVIQTYPYATSGEPNNVNVFVEATTADSIDGKGTPSQAILDNVAAVIEFDPDATKPLNERGRRPLTVEQVHVLPGTIKEIDIILNSFTGISVDDQNQLFDAFKTALATVRPFVSAADILANKNDIFDTNRIISIVLESRPGSVFGGVTLKVNGIIYNSWTFENGDIPHLNTVTFP